MKILRIDEARAAIGENSTYLSTLNDENIKIRGGADLKDLIHIRRKAVVDLFLIENYKYYNALQNQIDKYRKIKSYEKYTRHTGVILSDGSDEQQASHCHNNNIIISIQMLKDLDYVFAHELWHIISRNITRAQRNKIYKSFDIFPCTIKSIVYADGKTKSKGKETSRSATALRVDRSATALRVDKLNFLQNPDSMMIISRSFRSPVGRSFGSPRREYFVSRDYFKLSSIDRCGDIKSVGTYSFEIMPGYRIVILPLIQSKMFDGSMFVGKLFGSCLVEITGREKKYTCSVLEEKYKTKYLIGADEVVAEIFSRMNNEIFSGIK